MAPVCSAVAADPGALAGATPGFHRIDWPALGATLDLAILEVEAALDAWQGKADAWFLDGFAPARNPEMWREPVLAQVAAHCAPGARLATYTVAGAVRSGLAAQGFAVARQPGFGRKRARLEAHWPGDRIEPAMPRVAIVGAGIAGAALARAFAALGVPATVFSAGPMASGNPAALISPRLIAGDGPEAQLCAQAFRRSVDLIAATAPQAILARGLVRLERTPKDSARFDRIARDHVLGRTRLRACRPPPRRHSWANRWRWAALLSHRP
ncbi:tRNA (5-methylaminomethyl-2-thiouridine)(34)-methyltransferase MnmD [Hankyongella ginsenosidimutans]|uniref:tRNA (5-methylaminomethyl-2-thiouridine)(34)-methyltransferase MnmD n=1 Tax=Hankyongella ginsenosidimutans TaxID=1763828 RepID=UPI001CA3437B|nr:FAD-dependent oxidoreductase [Hankyongella ginsenosidimutans]